MIWCEGDNFIDSQCFEKLAEIVELGERCVPHVQLAPGEMLTTDGAVRRLAE